MKNLVLMVLFVLSLFLFPGGIQAQIIIDSTITCNGLSNGQLTASNFGVGIHTYVWNTGETTQTITGLSSGSYSVTVTDATLVSQVQTESLTDPPLLTVFTTFTNVSCNGGSNGTAIAFGNGGTIDASGYDYLWSTTDPGDTIPNVINLSAGITTVTLTDLNGCIATDDVLITQPPVAINVIANKTDVLCFGDNTGEASVLAFGGTGNLSYSWSNGGGTDSISNLLAGNYQVVVTDENGCTQIQTISIIQPLAPIAISTVFTDVNCNGGSDGTITATTTGGTGFLTHSWSNGSSSTNLSGLSAGSYGLIVTDDNNCVDSTLVTITEPLSPLTLSINSTNISCFGFNDGFAAAVATGGTGALNYAWSNGENTASVSNLQPGLYSVTVTDDNNCIEIADVLIEEPPIPITLIMSETDVLCFGDTTGNASVFAFGGSGELDFLWSTGDTTSVVSNLLSGVYNVTITDSNGCVATDNVVISQPLSPISISTDSTNISCNGGSDGNIIATATGGTGGLTYLWSTTQVTPTISNLIAGTYGLTVTDGNACTISRSITIVEPSIPLQVSIVSTDISCFGFTDGAAIANASGGVGGYDYLWSTGDTISGLSNLSDGTYDIVVTDSNGCVTNASVHIIEPLTSIHMHTIVLSNVQCNGGSNGEISATATGGVGTLDYLWSTGDTTQTLSGLVANTYTVVATDAHGCNDTAIVDITEPSAILVSSTIIPSSCDGFNDGSIDIVVSGGVMPYDFLWTEISFDSTYVTQNLNNVRGGNYILQITDSLGCVYLDTLTIVNNAFVDVDIVNTTYVCNGDVGSVSITALDADTNIYYIYAWSSAYTNGSFTTNDSVFTAIPAFAAGDYSITVTSPNGCVFYYDSVINQSTTPLVVTASVQHNVCYEDFNGGISLQVNGGDPMPGYHVDWIGPDGFISTAFNISGLGVGDYTYVVMDDSVCSKTEIIRIEPLSPLQGSIIASDITCNAYSNGTLQAVYSGGTGNLSYSWSSGETSAFIDSLTLGSYYLTVTDSVGCFYLDSAMIVEPNAISIILDSIQDVSCFGQNDGSIWINTSGGTGSLTYSWLHDGSLFSEITEDIVDIYAGTYSVNVRDSLGCLVQTNFVVDQPMETIFADSIHAVSCNNGSDAYWEITPSGFDHPYIAEFSTGDIISTDTIASPYISGLSAGIYSVVVTAINGCVWDYEINIEQPLPLTVGTVDIVPVVCKGNNTGSVTVDEVYGGTAPYVFLWDNEMSTNPILDVPADMYNVTITDANGCIIYETYEVSEPYEWIKYFPTVTETSCRQSEDGEIILYDEDIYSSPFNNMFYLYDSLGVLVDSVSTSQSIIGLASGNYVTIVINEYGCSSTDSIYIGQKDEDCIIIPNIVTMNDDGFNDNFKVDGGCEYDEFYVQIFTDKGAQVFESSECDFTWDPHENNALANSVYFYYISVVENGKTYEFKSSINITK